MAEAPNPPPAPLRPGGPGELYVVATPIGNMEDMTGRAKRVLGEVDWVAAEDTRVARRLLGLLGLKNRVVSNHKFNEAAQADFWLEKLEKGESVALITDAGTPCLSDPGAWLVRAAAAKGLRVTAVAGPSAVTAAISISGFAGAAYTFYGFLPKPARAAGEALRAASRAAVRTAVFFESPRRIAGTMDCLAAGWPAARVCLCNDLTKLHEKLYRGSPAEVAAALLANPMAEKGEYTLVVSFPAPEAEPEADPLGLAGSPEARLADYLARRGGTLKDAIEALAASESGGSQRNALYAAALRMKGWFA